MIPHNSPTLDAEEKHAAAVVLDSGWLAPGSHVESFENELCEFLELPQGHAVALSSGTAALFMALWALGARDKNVAFPVYACSALRNAVAMSGGREMLLDVRSGTPNLDPGDAARMAPDILIAPHMFGLPIDLSAMCGIPVIEDCAQAIGARMKDVPVGLMGEVGVFSFYATKLMTSGGEGGMLVSRDKAIVDGVRDYRDFDCRRDRKPRFNFQMSDLQAAIGRVQLRKLPAFLERREALFNRYMQAGLSLLDAEGHAKPVRYRAVLRTQRPLEVIQALAEREIRAIVPVEDWELLGDGNAFPNALGMSHETVSLPLYPALSDESVDEIIGAIA